MLVWHGLVPPSPHHRRIMSGDHTGAMGHTHTHTRVLCVLGARTHKRRLDLLMLGRRVRLGFLVDNVLVGLCDNEAPLSPAGMSTAHDVPDCSTITWASTWPSSHHHIQGGRLGYVSFTENKTIPNIASQALSSSLFQLSLPPPPPAPEFPPEN